MEEGSWAVDNSKPILCPYCGSEAHVMELKKKAAERYFVACSNPLCIAHDKWVFGKFFFRKADAIKAWNRRTTNQQLETENLQLLTTVKQLQKERDAALKQLQGHCWCCKKGKPLREGSSLMICPHFGARQVIAGMRSGCPEWEWNEGKEFEHEQ